MVTLAFVGLSQTLFVILLTSLKENKTISDKILIAWFSSISLFFCVYINMKSTFFNFPVDRRLGFVLVQICYGPFLYVYVKSILDEYFKLNRYVLIHFLPLIVAALMLVYFFTNLEELENEFPPAFSWSRFLMFNVIVGTSVTYSIRSLLLLLRHRKTLKENFSTITVNITLKWVSFIIYLMLASFLLLHITAIIELSVLHQRPEFVAIPNLLGFTLLAFAVSYFGVKQSSLFHHVAYEPTKKEEHENLNEISEKLMDYMKLQKPYLKADLTIQELADYLHILRSDLSEVLNQYYKKNFFTFINEFRVEEVKSRMKEKENEHLTLLAIGLDSGFNSKTTFNTIFKQYTGKTPSEYRSSIRSHSY